MPKTFKVGEKYTIVGDGIQPVVAEIFVLTNKPGKLIGMKLPHKMVGAHSLDGRVEHGFGLWTHPQHLFTEEEHKVAHMMRSAPQPIYSEIQEIVFDEDTHQVLNLPSAEIKEEPKLVAPVPSVPPKVESKAETKPSVKPVSPTPNVEAAPSTAKTTP